MTMKELSNKFLSLLRYVPYIIDKKPKIQWFLSYFPIMFKEWIEYGNPKTLEEAMRMENLCYDQNKNKRESIPSQKNKTPNNFDPRKKHNKFLLRPGNSQATTERDSPKSTFPTSPLTVWYTESVGLAVRLPQVK